MSDKFYITAAIPYVNAKPHIGHALEFVQTDVIGRHQRTLGKDVIQLSGGDENALKNVQAAENANEDVQSFVDKNNALFEELTKALKCQFDVWQKGSDKEKHFPASQKLWELCRDDIYKKSYEGLYCVGCETFYEKEDLNENGECFEHPGKPLEKVSEENYFFKLSKYQDELLKIIETDQIKIYPEFRKNEVLSFIKQGLSDISISRSNERAKNWGVPVPGDETQRMYVWFDALNIYQSGIGFGNDDEKYNKYWPADLHVIGKGIIRFHAIYWPAFLLSAKLKLPKALFVHGYFTVDGQKMSKTLGNVIDPHDLISIYGADALRYYFLAKFAPFSDGDFTEEKLKESYNADLANGLGNLVARVAKLCETSGFDFPLEAIKLDRHILNGLDRYEIDDAIRKLWQHIKHTDQMLSETKPWTKEGEELEKILRIAVEEIRLIYTHLKPFLPETADKIEAQFGQSKIKSANPLFARIK